MPPIIPMRTERPPYEGRQCLTIVRGTPSCQYAQASSSVRAPRKR
jgi:hypothetical protein